MRLVPSPPSEILSGQVFYQDKDLFLLPWKEMASIRGKEISMVFQEPMTSLNPVLTVGTQMMEVLKRQEFNEGIPQGVPPGTTVGHKTGQITEIHHDVITHNEVWTRLRPEKVRLKGPVLVKR